MTPMLTQPGLDQVRSWLSEVPDPEVPAVSVMDLGIVQDVQWQGDELVVAITPTYSGCPATSIIALDIEMALRARGIGRLRIERQLSPAWTTDWITEEGRQKLEAFGIAPPAEKAQGPSPFDRFLRSRPLVIACPRCRSENTFRVSEFGSTPCKAQYQCRDCLEPFDYFKCI